MLIKLDLIKNQREGRWIQYYREGKIAESFNYKNGFLEGIYTVWNNFSIKTKSIIRRIYVV
jgi:antitoxin component YwqK of YwqJK toxin-antitoxin module